jgi:Tol biopolymer transport system component
MGQAPATTALGLAATLVWLVAAYVAYRGIGWFTPHVALPILMAGAPLALALGLAAARLHRGRGLVVIGTALIAASLLLPFAIAKLPGVGHPEQFPLPGRPTLVLTAAPEGNFELWLMRGDANHVTRLTTTAARESGGVLSPDGTHVAYATNASGTFDLSVMTLGRGGIPGDVRTIAARDDADENWPEWSPDGSRIAYSVYPGVGSEVWVVNADGTHAHRISAQTNAAGANWSPDGSRIAYGAGTAGDVSDIDIWVTNADGSNAVDTIAKSDGQWAPFWSPDGASLLFTSNAAGNEDVWTCTLPCTELRNLTAGASSRDWADGWTPDGHALVLSDRLHAGGIFLYFIDDEGRMRLSVII